MFIIFFLRWLRGHIRFSARSGSIERFINLCAYHHIPSWECRRSDGAFSGCTTVSGYRRMHRLARKAGVVTRVTERYGLPFLIHRYRKRLGILIGVLFFALFLTVMQQFIWVIRVEGNEQIDSRILTNALADLGVHRGSFKGRIDAGVLREELVIRVDGLAWAALNIRGTTATLLVRERVRPPEKIDTDVPANVVAARDGQIKRLEVTDGRSLLRVGDTVREGEIIVSGVNEDRWGMTHLVRANARVIAHIPESLKIEVPLVQEEYVLTGEIKISNCSVCGSRSSSIAGWRGTISSNASPVLPSCLGWNCHFSSRGRTICSMKHGWRRSLRNLPYGSRNERCADRKQKTGGIQSFRQTGPPKWWTACSA